MHLQDHPLLACPQTLVAIMATLSVTVETIVTMVVTTLVDVTMETSVTMVTSS